MSIISVTSKPILDFIPRITQYSHKCLKLSEPETHLQLSLISVELFLVYFDVVFDAVLHMLIDNISFWEDCSILLECIYIEMLVEAF